ncbi:MAG: Trk system potassium transporter TrkA [Prevotella sp.]|jgi:trk system potassium uptake protein|nr:Trk system potassium transporter TrkA [Prevotella sp.]
MKIIIVGAYAIGTHLARLLSRNNEDITLIDEDEERLAQIGNDCDLLTMNASPSSINTLMDAGVAHTSLFIAVTPSQSLNLNTCIIAHALGAKKTVAKINDAEFIADEKKEFFRKLGVDELIYPEVLAARDIINGLKMSWVRQRWDVHDGALVMLGIKLREACEILNKPLKEISGPNDPYHVVAIKRDTDTIIPGGNDVLKLYDLAYFMTTKQYIPYIRKIVGKEHYVDVKNVMIMGGGTTAVRAIQTMPEYMDVKVLENNINRCEELNDILENDKTLVINGDGRDIPLLYEEGIKNTQAFVALTGNAETNILACLTAKRMGVRKTVAVVENIDYVSMAESLDIGTIINKKAIAASRIYQMMLDADVMNVTFLMSANADVAEFIPKEGSKITQKPVKDLGLPQGMTIGGLVRNDQGMLVSGNTMIQAGDSVVVFCHGQNIKKIERLFT